MGRMGPATPAQTEAVLQTLEPAREIVADYRRYVDRLLDLARADLREAELGLGVSLVKEGLEVLRDHREGLRAAIDPPGLTEDSHRYFMTEYVPLVNRAVIGPQKERIQELLVLVDAGIVSLGPGRAPKLAPAGAGWILTSTRLARPHRIAVDMVIRANLTWPAGCGELDPIGLAATWVALGNCGSLRLDRDGFAVQRGRTSIATGPARGRVRRGLRAAGRGRELPQPLRTVPRRLVPGADRPGPGPRTGAQCRAGWRSERIGGVARSQRGELPGV